MRYVENALRKREKYAGRLRGIELSEAVLRAIDRSLTAKTAEDANQAGVVIDLSRAAELERDSWDNTRRLIEAVQDAQPEEEQPQEEIPAEPFAGGPETLPPLQDEEPETSAAADAGGWQAFADALEPVHRTLLQAMLAGADAAALSGIAAQAFSFPEALYDDINELAADMLGDILIDAENGEIYEEHRAGLASVI